MLFFVTPAENQFPGIRRLFEETQTVVGGELIYLSDLQKVEEEDSVVFGAWNPQYAMAIRRNCKAKKKYLHWASPLLQAELAGVEIGYLNMIMTLLKQEVLDGIWVLDKGVYDAYKDIGNVFYAPAPFNPDQFGGYRKGVGERAEVSFFSIFHNRQKNPYVQLAAVKAAQRETPFTLYVNGLTPEQTSFANMIGLKRCELHHLPKGDYFEWASLSKLGMQVSVSEAFDYVAAEFLNLEVPVLMSPVVARNMGIADERLIINDISSVGEIEEGILNILGADEKGYKTMCDICRKSIEYIAIRNNHMVADMFRTHLQ